MQAQIEKKGFSSHSEVTNDLISKARKKDDERQAIRVALIEGKNSGISTRTPTDIVNAVIEKRRKNGTL